jgi:hypothetical protein
MSRSKWLSPNASQESFEKTPRTPPSSAPIPDPEKAEALGGSSEKGGKSRLMADLAKTISIVISDIQRPFPFLASCAWRGNA